jgi:hypothetical protein
MLLSLIRAVPRRRHPAGASGNGTTDRQAAGQRNEAYRIGARWVQRRPQHLPRRLAVGYDDVHQAA